jgi:hypothetical protein
MAFEINKLGLSLVNGSANLPRNWLYITPDAASVVQVAGYFNKASRLLRANDTMDLVTSSEGTPVHSRAIVNSVVMDGAVDITDPITLTATDSD